MINNVVLIGNITKDIELNYIKSEKGDFASTRFNLAVSRNKETTDFLEIKALGRNAEILNEYTRKGSKIAVSGRLQQDKWEKEGKNYYSTYVYASSIQLLDKKAEPKLSSSDTANDNVWSGAKDIELEAQDLPFY